MANVNRTVFAAISWLIIVSLFTACGEPKDKSPFYGRNNPEAKAPEAKVLDAAALTTPDSALSINVGKGASCDGKTMVVISGSINGSQKQVPFKFSLNAADTVDFTKQVDGLVQLIPSDDHKSDVYMTFDGRCLNTCTTIYSKLTIMIADQAVGILSRKDFAIRRVSGNAVQDALVELTEDKKDISIEEVVNVFSSAPAAVTTPPITPQPKPTNNPSENL